jgi:hypothetical protein
VGQGPSRAACIHNLDLCPWLAGWLCCDRGRALPEPDAIELRLRPGTPVGAVLERMRRSRCVVIRALIESRWVSQPLAFAGELQPPRPNHQPRLHRRRRPAPPAPPAHHHHHHRRHHRHHRIRSPQRGIAPRACADPPAMSASPRLSVCRVTHYWLSAAASSASGEFDGVVGLSARCAGRFHLGCGPVCLRSTYYVPPVLVKKYRGWKRPGRHGDTWVPVGNTSELADDQSVW